MRNKRLLATLLTLIMIITMIPVEALAAVGDYPENVYVVTDDEYASQDITDTAGSYGQNYDVSSDSDIFPGSENTIQDGTGISEEGNVPVENSDTNISGEILVTDDTAQPAIIEGTGDETDTAEPVIDEEILSAQVAGEYSAGSMYYCADLTGITVEATVPSSRTPKGSCMTVDIVDVSAYAEAIESKFYGKAVNELYGLEVHFFNKKGTERKNIDLSDITVTVEAAPAESYMIGRVSGDKISTLMTAEEPIFTFSTKKTYTFVFAGLVDDGILRSVSDVTGTAKRTFNLGNGDTNISVAAPKGAFSGTVAMEVCEVPADDVEEAVNEVLSDDEQATVLGSYDISFHKTTNGTELEPKKNVTVTINMPLDPDAALKLIHINDDGIADVVDGAVFTESGVTYKAKEFSVYVIVDSDDNGGFDYDEVIGSERVKVKAPEGAFPAGTEMQISAVEDAEELAKVAATLDSSKLHSLFALDISFRYEGDEVEPQFPVEVTWESANIDSDDCQLVHLCDNGEVKAVEDAAITSDKAVFTADSFSTYILVGTERQATLPIDHFTFNPSNISTEVTEIAVGNIADNAPEIDGYTFDKATVRLAEGGEDVAIEVGAFIAKYEDNEDPTDTKEEYQVFYRTADSLQYSDMVVLIAADQTITLNYNKTPYKVTYKIVYNGITYTVGTDTLPAELNGLVFSGPDSVAENTTYEQVVKLSLPRGYSAKLRMSNESSDQEPVLGEYSEPTYTCTDGWTVTPDSYPFTIDGLYTIANVQADLTVTVNLSKRESYRFSATPAFSTAYFGGRENEQKRYQDPNPSLEFSFDNNTTTFTFTTRNYNQGTYWRPNYTDFVLDSFNINKQTIRVPFVSATHTTDSATTTLKSGTEITMEAVATPGTNYTTRTYTVRISNCYENITITGGNLHNANDKREWAVQETANIAEFDYLADEWLKLVPGEPMTYARNTDGTFKPRVIRFKVKEGYVNPQIRYIDQNGNDLYQRVGGVNLDSAATDKYHLITSAPDPDDFYYFNLSYISTDPDPGLLSARAELARYGVSYSAGTVSGATIPGFDEGGRYGDTSLRGYNIEDNNMIGVAKIVPSDPTDEYVFLNYTVEGDPIQKPYAPNEKVPLASVAKFASYDSSRGEYVIPLKANWIKKEHAETVTIRVKFMLDTEYEREVDVLVTKDSAVYIDIDTDEMEDFMEDYNWQLFYDEVGSNPYIERASEDREVDLQCYSKFYVYHSATDTLELHSTKELLQEEKDGQGNVTSRSIGTLDMTGLTKENYYYGGYYKDYLGAHVGNTASGKNLVKEAADKNDSEGTLSPADIVDLSEGKGVEIPEYAGAATKYDPVNNESHLAYWTRANVFMTTLKKSTTDWFSNRGSKDTAVLETGGIGNAVKIARAGIYYLHEVPNDYLATPKVATVRDQNGEGAITKMFLLSAVDINIFRSGGVKIINTDKKGSFAKTFTLTKYDDGTRSVVSSDEQSAKTLFNVYGYLSVTDGASCMADGSYTLDPYWTTYDNITVYGSDVVDGHVRNITVSDNVVS